MTSYLNRIDTWNCFTRHLSGSTTSCLACLLGGELLPSRGSPVDPLRLLEEARAEPRSRILRQATGDALDLTADGGDEIRAMPLEAAAAEPFLHLSLFDLTELRRPGRVLHRLSEELFVPLENLWRERGMRWEGDFWPILFIGGARSATNYHIDPTPNVTFHLFGEKRFHSLKEPDRWCPQFVKDAYLQHQTLATRPPGITDADILTHDNAPGDAVFIPFLTPHWVNAGSLSATITFAFRGLQLGEKTHRPLR